MMRSLRSRLIVGMLVGMAVLLAAAGTTIYTVQRRQLYQAFDNTLLGSANALTLLIHPGPFGNWFDREGLARLPAGQIREGAVFQIWSDQPIDIPPRRPGPDADRGGPGPPPREDSMNDGPPPPDAQPPDDRPPRGGRHPRDRRAPPDDPGPPDEPGPGDRRRPDPPDPDAPRGPAGPDRRPILGQRIIRSDSLGAADLPQYEAVIGGPRFERLTLPDGRPGRAVAVRFAAPGPPVRILRGNPGNITAVVAASTVELDAQLAFLGVLLAVTAVGTMAVAGGVAWLAVSRGLRPLERVARDIGALDETGLKQRIAARGVPREIEPLVNQLNDLLARLDEAFNRERALTADIAHELRTPVAEVRAITEVTLSRPRPPEEYRRALGETLESARALQGLIEKLLVLARLEAGQVQPELEALALGPLLADHWGAVAERAAARRLNLINQAAPDVVVAADAKLVGVVLSNVFANAVTYTPEGHDVTITTQMSPDRCRLEVANGGCVLRPEDVNRVFDRFWRADPSRGRSGLHCGLGLTLVRRAMEAMGGTAGAEVRAGGRFVLALELPRTR